MEKSNGKERLLPEKRGALPEGVEGEETLLVHRHSSGALE